MDPRGLAIRNSKTFTNLPASTVFLCMGALCLLVWALLNGFGLAWLRWAILVLAVPFTVNGIRLAIRDGPLAAYWTRGAGIHLVVALTAPTSRRLDRPTQRTKARQLGDQAVIDHDTVATAFLVALLVVPTVCALRWATVISNFRETITQHEGIVPQSDVTRSAGTSYLWSWTNTTMSVILRSSNSNAVVENTDRNNLPFNLDRAQEQIPGGIPMDESAR